MLKTTKPQTPNVAEKRDIGAIVFLIAHATGDYEIMSVDRQVYASGSSLDQAFWRYYKKGKRIMEKREQLERAHPTVETEDAPIDNAFSDV